MIERVAAVPVLCLVEDVHDDSTFDDAEAARLDCPLQLVGAVLDNGFPVVAAAVCLVHGELCARAVLVTGVLGQDCADQRVKNRRGISAAGDVARRDDCVGTAAVAVDGCEDAVSGGAFLGCWMGEGWEG